jgi:hypothetical protein
VPGTTAVEHYAESGGPGQGPTSALSCGQDVGRIVPMLCPYVFIDSLTLAPPGTQRPGADPTLRLTLGLHALWRRGAG